MIASYDTSSLKAVFTARPDRLRAGEANVALEPVLGNRSVLLLDGAEHIRQRRLMLPPFHGERLRGYEDLIAEIADEEIRRWPAGEKLALQPRMQAVTLEVIMSGILPVLGSGWNFVGSQGVVGRAFWRTSGVTVPGTPGVMGARSE